MNHTTKGAQPKIIYQLEVDDLEQIIANAVTDAMERYTSSTTPAHDNNAEELMTLQQVSGYLHRSRSTLWRYEQLGILKPIRRGRCIYYNRADVESIFDKIL